MRAILLLAILSGCGAPALTITNHVGLVVQSAVLACDWGQTRRAADMGWAHNHMLLKEDNPLLGDTPSAATVDAYFVAVVVLTALGWHVLPHRWKLVVPIVIVAIQANSIVHNLGRGGADLGVCGHR